MACNGNSMTPGNHMCNKRCWLRSCGSCTDGTKISLPQTQMWTQAEPSIISSLPPSHLIRVKKRHDWLCMRLVTSGVENLEPICMMLFLTLGLDLIQFSKSVFSRKLSDIAIEFNVISASPSCIVLSWVRRSVEMFFLCIHDTVKKRKKKQLKTSCPSRTIFSASTKF